MERSAISVTNFPTSSSTITYKVSHYFISAKIVSSSNINDVTKEWACWKHYQEQYFMHPFEVGHWQFCDTLP